MLIIPVENSYAAVTNFKVRCCVLSPTHAIGMTQKKTALP